MVAIGRALWIGRAVEDGADTLALLTCKCPGRDQRRGRAGELLEGGLARVGDGAGQRMGSFEADWSQGAVPIGRD